MGRKLIRVTDTQFLEIAGKKFAEEAVPPVFKRGEDGLWRITNVQNLRLPASYYLCAMMDYDDNPIWDDYNNEPI